MQRRRYENKLYAKFVDDMQEAGFNVKHYIGKLFYRGPAVKTKDLKKALAATDVPLTWESVCCGKYYVYPMELRRR